MWQELKLELALVAFKAVHPLKAVGWDIAITNRGPIIIEGNRMAAMGKIRPFFHGYDLERLTTIVA